MNKFDYVIEKIRDADFDYEPFKHIYIGNFFSDEDFKSIIGASEISFPQVENDGELFSSLLNNGYKAITFPGCITDKKQYQKWHANKAKSQRTHSACEGFGMVFRLFENKSQILIELQKFMLSESFNKAIADKFEFDFNDCKIDGGIQKYLDGYEISPHPDIRKKAATYMVNVNPSDDSETANHHTHYLKLKDTKKYVGEFWENNKDYERDWLPWDWCETQKQQTKNNSIVIFSPSNDTIHAVKADYNHLATQRTQLYGNLWYLESNTKKLKWEELDIPNTTVSSSLSMQAMLKNFRSSVPTPLKSVINSMLRRNNDDIGKTNMN
jgi:hypothetical protein